MSLQVNTNNEFYNTFTPFITSKTRSAEKTMNGKVPKKNFSPPYKFGKEFYNYITAGGLLAFPVLAILISQKNVFAAIRKSDLEMFHVFMNKENPANSLSFKIAKKKKSFLSGFWDFISPIKRTRESVSRKIKAKDNESFIASTFNGINDLFKRLKKGAAYRRYKYMADSFNTLEKSIETRLHVFEESSSKKLKIMFPAEILRPGVEEMPYVVDLSKTAAGKNRAKEARKIIAQIKKLLSENTTAYEKVVQKITFSCEDVFFNAEAALSSIFKHLRRNNLYTNEVHNLIKNIYNNLQGYRFAEKNDALKNLSAPLRRKAFLQKAQQYTNRLKTLIPASEKHVRAKIKKLDYTITQRAKPENMGLIEQLRDLLKCNDIIPKQVLKNKHSSLYKLYSPDDYFLLKKEMKDFVNALKFAHKTQKHLLKNDLSEIDRGGIFTKAVAVGTPAAFLGANIWNSKPGEEKAKSKRNFYSFIVGSAVMLASNYCTMNSQKRSIIYGILSAFLTSRIVERYIKN